MRKPKVLEGKMSVDARGSVKFINSFTFPDIKRFYQVENADTEIIRAFHGHMKEEKYVFVTNGKILLCAVSLDDTKTPSKKSKVYTFTPASKNPQIVHIPAGFANGFKALQKNSTVLFFSTTTLKQSLKDDYRFPFDYWGKDVWKNK